MEFQASLVTEQEERSKTKTKFSGSPAWWHTLLTPPFRGWKAHLGYLVSVKTAWATQKNPRSKK